LNILSSVNSLLSLRVFHISKFINSDQVSRHWFFHLSEKPNLTLFRVSR
jgi:hypothetical protein